MSKKQINPFDLPTIDTTDSNARKLAWTPELISKSSARALALIKFVGSNPELHELANVVLDEGDADKTIELIDSVFDEETIKADAQFMTDATVKELERLLESRRSDRSKAKAKGPRKSLQHAQAFISAMYAELLVREILGKPYEATGSINIDELGADQDALNRKIRSLQSKQTRLGKIAKYDTEAAAELADVQDEIERLKSLRVGAPRVSGKTIIKSADADTLRAALSLVQLDSVDAETAKKISEALKMLG